MKFYYCKISFECEKDNQVLKIMKKNRMIDWGHEIIFELNETLHAVGEEEKFFMIICDAKFYEFEIAIMENIFEQIDSEYAEKFFNKCISQKYKFKNIKVKLFQETTAKFVRPLIEDKAQNMSYVSFGCRFCFPEDDVDSISFRYYDDPYFKIEEKIFNAKNISREQALKKAEKMMLDKNFKEELERIYYEKNSKKFLGHPVHYKLTVKNSKGGNQLSEFLCQTLYANNRIVSRRISFISEIRESCYGGGQIEIVFEQASGSTMVINLCGTKTEEDKNYATAYEEVVEYFVKMITKYQRNTLFIFIETTENPGFATNLIKTLQEEIYLIELKESSGTYEQAFNFLKELVAEGNLTGYGDEDIQRILGGKNLFTPSDVSKAYENLHRDYLRNNSYSAYKNVSRLLMKKIRFTETERTKF